MYCLLPSICLSRYLSGHLLSRTPLVTRYPTHVVPSRSPGGLSMTNIHSLLPMSAFSPYISLDLSPLFVRPLLATCQLRGLALSVPNNHTLSPHLASVVEDACVICLHKTRMLFLYFYHVLSMSLSHTHTHFFSHSFYFTHTLSSQVLSHVHKHMDVLKSQPSEKFDQVYVEKNIYIWNDHQIHHNMQLLHTIIYLWYCRYK